MCAKISREAQIAAIDAFNKYVVSQEKANLTRSGAKVSSGLYNSIKADYNVGQNSIETSFYMLDYGKFLDQGVKGAKSSNRAPASPYKFGSGTGKAGGLTAGIKKWVRERRIQFQGERKKFLSYDQTAQLITRSIYNKGIRPRLFLTKPFEVAFQRLPDELVEAYALDLDGFLKQTLDIK